MAEKTFHIYSKEMHLVMFTVNLCGRPPPSVLSKTLEYILPGECSDVNITDEDGVIDAFHRSVARPETFGLSFTPRIMNTVKDAMMSQTESAALLRKVFLTLCCNQDFLCRLQGILPVFPDAWPAGRPSLVSSLSVPRCTGPAETGMFLPAGNLIVVHCTEPGVQVSVVVSKPDIDDHVFALKNRYTMMYSPVGGRLVVCAPRDNGPFELVFHGDLHKQVLYEHGVTSMETWRYTAETCSSNICLVTENVTICAPAVKILDLRFEGVHLLVHTWGAVYSRVLELLCSPDRLEVVVSGDTNIKRGKTVFTHEWALHHELLHDIDFWRCYFPEHGSMACLHVCIQALEMSWEQACFLASHDPSSKDTYLSLIGQDQIVPLSCTKPPQKCPQVCNRGLVPWKKLSIGENTVSLVFDHGACKVSSIVLAESPFTITQGGLTLPIEHVSVGDYEVTLIFSSHIFAPVHIELQSPDMRVYGSHRPFIFCEQSVVCTIEISEIMHCVPKDITDEYCITEHVVHTHNVKVTNGIFAGSGYMLLDKEVLRLLCQSFELRFSAFLSDGHTGLICIGQGRRNELHLSALSEGGLCTLTLCLYDHGQQAHRLQLPVDMGSWLDVCISLSQHAMILGVNESNVETKASLFNPEVKVMIGSYNMSHAPIKMSHVSMTRIVD